MAQLLYQGHGSLRLTTDSGKVIYIDPYAGQGYNIPADFILVTHQHGDHNQTHLVTQNTDCVLITNDHSLENGKHNNFSFEGLKIEAVSAENKNHDPNLCVGFIVEVDGVKVYFSGDTSKTAEMDSFPDKKLDYAILCCDGVYNMNPDEAAQCAEIIKAKHNIPVHMKPGELFDIEIAKNWKAPNKLIVEPGQEIEL